MSGIRGEPTKLVVVKVRVREPGETVEERLEEGVRVPVGLGDLVPPVQLVVKLVSVAERVDVGGDGVSVVWVKLSDMDSVRDREAVSEKEMGECVWVGVPVGVRDLEVVPDGE